MKCHCIWYYDCMAKPDQLLTKWKTQIPRDGVDCEDLVAVMRYLGMAVTLRKSGHWTGSHERLIGSALFPNGVITVNCHAFGKQGKAHPRAVADVVKAAELLQEEE